MEAQQVKKEKLSDMYKQITKDAFPEKMEIRFVLDGKDTSLLYEKVYWNVGGEKRGLRYGENPCQPASLYRLVNGNIAIGEVETVLPGNYLASDVELLQSGKHPGKTNITDVDNALNILRYFTESPTAIIIKHNNPCGAAQGPSMVEAYTRALMADRIAAFGGAVAVNRSMDRETAEAISRGYTEVVAAPDFEDGTLDILGKRKNLRVMRIKKIEALKEYVGKRVLDFTSLMDGGLVLQLSYSPKALSTEDFLPAETEHEGKTYKVKRKPSEDELQDLLFGWLVESGITSNSVIYVKDKATVGIGTGEQDRVGVAEIARDKAYRKTAEKLAWEALETSYTDIKDPQKREEIDRLVENSKGGLKGSVMVSDAFFPFSDGVEVGLKEGVTAVVQPGGAQRDWDVIETCNHYGASMVFTGQRSFKH